jgi:hypothetical protein
MLTAALHRIWSLFRTLSGRATQFEWDPWTDRGRPFGPMQRDKHPVTPIHARPTLRIIEGGKIAPLPPRPPSITERQSYRANIN